MHTGLDFPYVLVYNQIIKTIGLREVSVIKKIGIFMSLLMGLTLSFVMSLVGTLTSGHFTVISWLISFGISFVISLAIGFIVPMPKIENAANRKLGLKPGSVPANAVSALISNTIYTPILSVAMVLIMVGSANAGIQKGIDALDSEITSLNTTISEVKAELTSLGDSDLERTGELNSQVAELQQKLGELNGQKAGMEAAKPPMGRSILISLLFCYPIGYIVIFIVQPLYFRMLMKKFGPPAGIGGPPVGMGRPSEGTGEPTDRKTDTHNEP